MTNGLALHMWWKASFTAVAMSQTQHGLSSALFSSLGTPQRRASSPPRPFLPSCSLRYPSALPSYSVNVLLGS